MELTKINEIKRKELSLGVDLGGSKINIALVDNKGSIIKNVKKPTYANKGKDYIIDNIKQGIYDIIISSGVTIEDLLGIGIGIPGQIDIKRGIVHSAPNLPGWEGVQICRILREEFHIPVILENDANAAAWGENTFGIARGVKNMVCLTLGTGIGGGLIFEGKIYHGHNFGAGEIGHIIVNKDGPRCHCGGVGCLETFSSATGIRDRISEKINKIRKISTESLPDLNNIGLAEIFKRARQGDPLFKDIVDDAIEYLGVGITTLVNLLNPEMIVLVGGIANEGEKILLPIKRFVFKRAMKVMLADLKIVLGVLQGQAGVIGAAALLWEKEE